jgi:Kef-type K+ transport system membrane component KefB
MTVHEVEELVVAVLLQLIVIIPAARLAGSGARAVGQPRVVGEIIAGLLLGPSLFGYFWPELSGELFSPVAGSAMQVLSQIGLLLLMFQIGADFEYGLLKYSRNSRGVLLIAVASVLTPAALGFVIGQVSHPYLAPGIDSLIYSLFVSVALAITALPVLGRILKEYNLTRTQVGVVAVSAAALNDVVGWVLLATVATMATSGLSLSALGWQVGGLALLAVVLALIGAPFVRAVVKRNPVVDNELPLSVMALVFLLVFACGIATQKLGVFTIFGGFLAGILFHSHVEFVKAWQNQIGKFVLVFFLPIFFTFTGLHTNVLGLANGTDWLWCLIMIAAAIVAKIVPVYVAARAGGFSSPDASVLGALMNTRGLMELIVLNVGYSMGFIPQNVFTMLVLMAVVTTMMTGPLLRVLLPRSGIAVGRLADA